MSKFSKSKKSYLMDCGYGAYDTRNNKHGVKSLSQCACACNEIDCIKFQYSDSTCRMKTLAWLDGQRDADSNTALDPPTVRDFDRHLVVCINYVPLCFQHTMYSSTHSPTHPSTHTAFVRQRRRLCPYWMRQMQVVRLPSVLG